MIRSRLKTVVIGIMAGDFILVLDYLWLMT